MAQNTVLHFVVEGGDFEDGDKVVDELARRNLGQELVSPILDTYVCQLSSG